jgi:hypothetical protein
MGFSVIKINIRPAKQTPQKPVSRISNTNPVKIVEPIAIRNKKPPSQDFLGRGPGGWVEKSMENQNAKPGQLLCFAQR